MPPSAARAVLLLAFAPAMAAAVEPQAVDPQAVDPHEKPVTLDRVQVIATRTPQASSEVPASVSVIEGADLATDTLGTTMSEKLTSVPGLLARHRQNLAQ